MEELFENWRKFEKEILKEDEIDIPTHAQAQSENPDLYHKFSKMRLHEYALIREVSEYLRLVISFVDPTGISEWPDVVRAYMKKKNAEAVLKKALEEKPANSIKIKKAETQVLHASAEMLLFLFIALPLWMGKHPKYANMLVKGGKKLKKVIPILKKNPNWKKAGDFIEEGLGKLDDFIEKMYPAKKYQKKKLKNKWPELASGGGTGVRAAIKAGQGTAKALKYVVGGVMNMGGQFYAIIKTPMGNVPYLFMKNMKEYVPFLGMQGKLSHIADITGINPNGIINVIEGGPRLGIELLNQAPELRAAARTFSHKGIVPGAGYFADEAAFLIGRFPALEMAGARTLNQISDLVNRGLAAMGKSGLSSNYIADMAINFHLKSKKVSFHLVEQVGEIPGITHMSEELFEKAIEMAKRYPPKIPKLKE